MSHLAEVLCTWRDVWEVLRRKSVSWRGLPLSDRDRDTFTSTIVMCSLHLIDMSSRYGGIGSSREIIAWAHNMCSLDVSELGSFLSDAVTLLRHVDSRTAYSWFKRQLAKDYPFVGLVLAPIRGALQDFLADPNPRGFYVCYQFLSFLTHVSLRDTDVSLETEYEELEHRLQKYHYPSPILRDMNNIMREWMKDFSITEENFFPQHGPGATFESRKSAGNLTKYRNLGSDSLIRYVFSHHAGVDVETYYPFPALEGVGRVSRFVSVPKSMKTRRAISAEPTTLQYLQQGVRKCLYEHIDTHPQLAPHISMRIQEKNAALAIRSSGDQQFATIDLSSASDTVTTTLVKAVFRGTPIYPYLVALRSNATELPSGKIVELAKYAPMGSALCFPIETLIFACAVEYTVRHMRGMTGYYPEYRVYGDDIIVRTPLFQDVLMTLHVLGFIANDSKSFSAPHRFRESCGGDGYDGTCVTPMRISRKYYFPSDGWCAHHADLYMGLIDMANQCHDYGFSLLRAWVIQLLLEYPGGPPLFSQDGRGALYSPWPDNYRAAHRYQPDDPGKPWYQRAEIQVAVSRSRVKRLPLKEKKLTRRDRIMEQARYFETLRLSRLRDGDMFSPEHRIHVPIGSDPPMLTKRWVENPWIPGLS